LREPLLSSGTFDKQKHTQVWPLPENVGITLERDHGLLVTSVDENSPAAKAGIRAGDFLAVAGGRKLFGQADFRGVLHRGPSGAGSIPVVWLRNNKPLSGTLDVQDGWRRTILDWRMSISQGNIGADVTFFPLAASKNERAAAGVGEDAMAVKPFLYKDGAAAKAGLKSHHIITAVNGESPDVSGRSFQWWVRQRFDAGARIKLTVKDGGAEKQIEFELP
jgi:serine protease Do